MKIGNWNITENGIEWAGDNLQRFSIAKDALLQTVESEDGSGDLYKWIVLATEEDWLSIDELYDLNFAFVYAAGAFDQPFDYDLFDKTVEYQFELLDDDEDMEP